MSETHTYCPPMALLELSELIVTPAPCARVSFPAPIWHTSICDPASQTTEDCGGTVNVSADALLPVTRGNPPALEASASAKV